MKGCFVVVVVLVPSAESPQLVPLLEACIKILQTFRCRIVDEPVIHVVEREKLKRSLDKMAKDALRGRTSTVDDDGIRSLFQEVEAIWRSRHDLAMTSEQLSNLLVGSSKATFCLREERPTSDSMSTGTAGDAPRSTFRHSTGNVPDSSSGGHPFAVDSALTPLVVQVNDADPQRLFVPSSMTVESLISEFALGDGPWQVHVKVAQGVLSKQVKACEISSLLFDKMSLPHLIMRSEKKSLHDVQFDSVD